MDQAGKPFRQAQKYPYFEEDTSADVVNARMGPDISPRLRQVMTAVVKHLHNAVKEIEPTHDEWLAAIKFLTDTGHMCTEWRQEFILLSDVLGVSMLVDSINHRRPSGATENTILGPFYVPDAPRYEHGANVCLDGKGEPMLVQGRVLDTKGKPIDGALLDMWQTNEDGFYDVQQKGVQPDFNLRGVFTSGPDGAYWFRSVKPRFYPIPNDGPVGKMLDALGRHPNRAAHIHFIVTAPGLRSRHHPHLRAELPLPVGRRGVRRQGDADRRFRAGGRCRRDRGGRLRASRSGGSTGTSRSPLRRQARRPTRQSSDPNETRQADDPIQSVPRCGVRGRRTAVRRDDDHVGGLWAFRQSGAPRPGDPGWPG